MTDLKFTFTPKYSNSRALIVGINNYKAASPLSYAVSDANEISDLLIDNFDFNEDSISCGVHPQVSSACSAKGIHAHSALRPLS